MFKIPLSNMDIRSSTNLNYVYALLICSVLLGLLIKSFLLVIIPIAICLLIAIVMLLIMYFEG